MTISHKFNRSFRPDKIHPPREFILPQLPAEQEIFLEVGAGKGMHAMIFGQNYPNSLLFAVERTKEKFGAFERRLANENLPNVSAIHADVVAWTVHALPPKSLAGIFILYPNPEPKNPNQRWLNMPFFEFLLSRLQIGGQLQMATNIKDYAQEAYEQAKDVWQLPASLSYVPAHSQRTHFEVKYLKRGERCLQLDLVKPKDYVTRFDSWQAGIPCEEPLM